MEFVGPMNSTPMHCSRLTWSNSATGTKKKKKRTKRDFPKRRCANAESKRTLNVILGLLRNLFVHKSLQKLVESVNLANMDTPSSIFVIDLNSRGCFCILEKQNP